MPKRPSPSQPEPPPGHRTKDFLARNPHAVVNLGEEGRLHTKSGLPVGYQAIAASGHDKTATAFSRLVEKELVGFVPPPGFD
jgi:Asp-tRNA(Asn)/Glu-tRNA(Gln) amidotransferase A subunit family amidase